MARIKFESIKSISAKTTGNPLTITLEGPREALDKVKKKLTIRDKSVYWQLQRLDKSTDFMTRQRAFFDEETEKYQEFTATIEANKKEMKILQEREILEFWTDNGTNLEVPAGFWFFADQVNSVNKNTKLEPWYDPRLRSYQIESLTELYKYLRATICLATGLGKSLIIASICKAAEQSGMRVCVVVPTDYLVGQMTETIGQLTKSVTGLGGGRKMKLGTNVCVTTAQSAMKVIDNFDVILIDEGHHAPAATWLDIFSNSRATHVYALTATPFRGDGLDMAIHAFCGPIVYERNARWGIENGWLKPCKVYLKTINYMVNGETRFLSEHMNSARAYKTLTSAAYSLKDTIERIKKMLDSGRKVIVIYKTVVAGQALKKASKGVLDFELCHAKWKKPIDDFRQGKIRLLVSNDRLLSEGVDIPDANALIMITQSSSPVTTYQALGRVLRKSEGFALVIDITLNGYQKFVTAKDKRAAVYREVTDDVFELN